MISQKNIFDLVIGLGETGEPLRQVLAEKYPTVGRDIDPVDVPGPVGVLHICYSFEIPHYHDVTVDYINQYQPDFTIIHSTVVPGTTTKVYNMVGGLVAYSPIRGKHTRMKSELLKYKKFVAGTTPTALEKALAHLKGADFKVGSITKTETLEAAKLIETTYFGLLIAWAQEIERFAKDLDGDYDEIMALTEEVSYLPPVFFRPGYIGGHCVISNIFLLEQIRSSPFLDVIRSSNEEKKVEWLAKGMDLNHRIAPKQKKREG